jgi:hypothetical protein
MPWRRAVAVTWRGAWKLSRTMLSFSSSDPAPLPTRIHDLKPFDLCDRDVGTIIDFENESLMSAGLDMWPLEMADGADTQATASFALASIARFSASLSKEKRTRQERDDV